MQGARLDEIFEKVFLLSQHELAAFTLTVHPFGLQALFGSDKNPVQHSNAETPIDNEGTVVELL